MPLLSPLALQYLVRHHRVLATGREMARVSDRCVEDLVQLGEDVGDSVKFGTLYSF